MIWSLVGCVTPTTLPPPALLIERIDLGSTSIGESTLVVGPDGTTVLIDVGNDRHDDEVTDALHGREPDFTVITHLHADHVGGLSDLDQTGTVIWRGRDVDTNEWTDPSDAIALCDTTCDLPLTIELGDGATLDILVADATLPDGTSLATTEENSRSLVGTVRYGDFLYLWAGDLTGGGKDTDDVETFVAEGLPLDGAVDVLHLNHHGITSSTNDAWLDRWLPGERDRNALVGANRAYLSAPGDEVVERVAPHLGEGRIWVTTPGSLADPHPACVDVDGSVQVRITEGGASYDVARRSRQGEVVLASFLSLVE
ncbi:MAG: MBL fold metallo-hydrolase [Proteobacteria bacterium]|nr:MBL fold metallo-hydrolase [Pseudomonadota bacterium]MCP4916312.1 MBL fold metallo-hydrolase [Pseudomonadota bacterium]